jgi:hypothetical protein
LATRALLAELKSAVALARLRAHRVVNTELLALYWQIGNKILEVVLGNALHEQLASWHGAQQLPGGWYDDPAGALDRHRRDDIAAVRVRIRREGKAEAPGKVVAELMFGFWRFLLDKRYEPTLWAQNAASRPIPTCSPSVASRSTTRCTPLSVSATGSRTTSRSTTCRYEPDTRTCWALPATSTPQSRRGSLESPGCRRCWEASPEGVPTHSSKKNHQKGRRSCRSCRVPGLIGPDDVKAAAMVIDVPNQPRSRHRWAYTASGRRCLSGEGAGRGPDAGPAEVGWPSH